MVENITCHEKQAIEFIKNLNLSEDDIEEVYEVCDRLFNLPSIEKIVHQISEDGEIQIDEDLENLLLKLVSKLKKHDLNSMETIFRKNPQLLDSLQELILEKLLR